MFRKNFKSPAEVGKLYADRDKPVPVLRAAAQRAVKACMQEHNYFMVGGSTPVPGEELTLGELLKYNRKNLRSKEAAPDNVIGPYFEDEGRGRYIPGGVGVWGPRTKYPQHEDLNREHRR